ncbi:MAG: DUF1192 domain-containing protein [Rhodobiaceae bacterium]|nr:DUF1192 domain-containing protein [Rhodobiaceae bacterium]
MDDEEPKKPRSFQIGQLLDSLSVDELEEVVGDLAAEIDRIKAEITRKKADLSAAHSLFKT